MAKVRLIALITFALAALWGCMGGREQRKDLLGYTTVAYWRANCGWSDFAAPGYSPDTARSARIGRLARERDASFLICASAGCSTCRDEVPRILRLLEAAQVPPERIRFLGLDRYAEDPAGEYKKYEVEFIPAVAVICSDKFIGLASFPSMDWERDIIKILEKK